MGNVLLAISRTVGIGGTSVNRTLGAMPRDRYPGAHKSGVTRRVTL